MKTATVVPNGSTQEVELPVVSRDAFVAAIESGIRAQALSARAACGDSIAPYTDAQLGVLRSVGQTARTATTYDYYPVDPRVSKGCPQFIAFGDCGSLTFASAFDRALAVGRTTDFVIE